MRRFLMAFLVTGAVVAPSAGLVFADSLPPLEDSPVTLNPSAEISVQTAIGSLIDDLDGNTVKNVQLDQVEQDLVFSCPVGTCPGKIIIEQAGFHADNVMGIYDLSDVGTDPDRVVLFVGGNVAGDAASFSFDGDGSVIVNGVDTNTFFDSGESFGVYIQSPSGIFFQEDDRNPSDRRHVVIFHAESAGVSSNGVSTLDHSFFFAFEDLPQGAPRADFDYNDFIYNFQIQTETPPPPVIPEPGTMLLFGLGGLGAAISRRRKSTTA